MNLKQAQEILEPYNIIIMYDDVLKIFKVFLGSSTVYITREDMKKFDEPDFKTAIAHSLIKDSTMNPRITLQ
jgi:hypothetical protein